MGDSITHGDLPWLVSVPPKVPGKDATMMGKHVYDPNGYCYNCGQSYVNTTTFCPKARP